MRNQDYRRAVALVFPTHNRLNQAYVSGIQVSRWLVQQQIEELTEVDLSPPEEGVQLLDFTDALYWSIITAASIGYGDITPQTEVGRAIAGALGLMGVITIGVIAGLILDWVSPRRID